MQYRCGAYNRLSDADNKNDESSSIQSQKMIIESFAKFNNLEIVKHYVDDGYSGGNYDRPGFQEMIADIESGKINCVITKDLSRLGRELYKTGRYIEEYFIEHGVRYIAINDSYDSNIGDSMLGIRLSVNDLYLRDVSKKVKTSLRAKQNKGDYIGSFPLYGYKKDPEDKHKLIVDEEVRGNIEFMYDLFLEGKSLNWIADNLTRRKVPIPIVYKQEPRGKNVVENDGFGIWKRQTITNILTNRMYVGDMVQNTFNKLSYNSKKLRKTSQEEWIIVENTHEGIVSRETFEKVQKILESRPKKRRDQQYEYLLGGLIYCKECGRSIRVSQKVIKSGIRHFTQCNLYTRKGKYGLCSSHRMNYDYLEEDIIEYLQQLCDRFCEVYDFNEVEDNSDLVIKKNLDKLNLQINKKQKKLDKYKSIIDDLYVDKTQGLVDKDMYKRIYDKTKKEIDVIELELKDLIDKRRINENQQNDTSLFSKCKKSVLDYMSLRIPTKEQINRLVEKIEIDQDKKVYIYLKFPELLTDN